MAKTIMLQAFKGGTAKSTSTLEIATIMSKRGLKVLVVDLDPQNNLTQMVGINEVQRIEYSITKTLMLKDDLKILRPSNKKFDIVTSDMTLAIYKSDLYKFSYGGDDQPKIPDYKKILKKQLDKISNNYDFILIDCPPSLDILVELALNASDYVYLPTQLEQLSVAGLDMNIQAIKAIIKSQNLKAQIKGIFFTIVENQRVLSTIIKEELTDLYGDLIIKTFIRKNVAICNAQYAFQSVTDYDPNSNGANDYRALTNIILKQIN